MKRNQNALFMQPLYPCTLEPLYKKSKTGNEIMSFAEVVILSSEQIVSFEKTSNPAFANKPSVENSIFFSCLFFPFPVYLRFIQAVAGCVSSTRLRGLTTEKPWVVLIISGFKAMLKVMF